MMSHQYKSLLARQISLNRYRIGGLNFFPAARKPTTARVALHESSLRYFSTKNDNKSSPKIHVHVEKSSSSLSSPPSSPFANSSSSSDTQGGCGNHNHDHAAAKPEIPRSRFTIPPQNQHSKAGSDEENNNDINPNSISSADHYNNLSTVQTRDYEHSYLPGILLSKATTTATAKAEKETKTNKEIDIQKFYFALRAFHIEIASIRNNETNNNKSGLSSGSNLALLRMRWWKESLNYLYPNDDNSNGSNTGSSSKKRRSSGNVGNNPTIRSLKHVVEAQKLSRHLFETMIDARIDDLEYEGGDGSVSSNKSNSSVDNFNSMNDMINFYSKTSSSLLLLQLECCGVKLFNDDGSDIDNNEEVERIKEVANCIGIGVGIINAIRSINTGRNAIPNDLISKYGVNMDDINDPRSIINESNSGGKEAIQNAVKEMGIVAKDFLYNARLHQGNIPKGDAKITLFSVVSAVRYMERLESLDYDIFHERLRDVENVESLNGRLWRLGSMFYLWRAWLTGVF